MNLESKTIENIYSGKLAKKYDFSMPHSFSNWKKKAFNESSLKKGDWVLVFCCGTGSDFPYILNKIGKDGKIIGVDFSAEMLEQARKKVDKNKWENVELIKDNVTTFENKLDDKANVGVCTLGMSIIPEYKKAYKSLLSNVKEKGEIIIGDMQLASGRHTRFNPLTILLSKRYGGTYDGHQNSLELQSLMKNDLTEIRKREFFLGSYYYCIGRKN